MVSSQAEGRADTRRISLTSGEVEFRESGAGDGEVVLLLHSLGLSSWLWDGVIGPLAERFRVIGPDFPGYGGSARPRSAWMIQDYAQWAIELTDALGVDRYHVVGNSFGAVVALEVVARAPERARRLALLGMPLWPDEDGRREWLRSRTEPLADDGSAKPATLETAAALIQAPTPEIVDRMNRDRAITGSWYQQTMWALAAYDPAPRMRALAADVLVAYGEHDPFRSGALVAEGLLPRASAASISGGGHFAPLDASDQTARELVTFLTASDRGGSGG